jgi:ComEC/Rec2-related protein
VIGTLIGLGFLAGFLGGWPLIPLIAALSILFALAVDRHWRQIPLLVVALVLGALRAPEPDKSLAPPSVPVDGSITVAVTSAVVDDGRVQRFRVTGPGWTACVRTFARADFGRGDVLETEIDLAEPASLSDGYRQYVRSQGCGGSGTLGRVSVVERGSGLQRSIDELRQSVTRMIISWVPGDNGALFAGLVIGDDALMSDEATDAFARTGTIHVVAVSGSNLALLASILVISQVLFVRRFLSEAGGIAIIWGYVLLAGAVPPTLRAGLLATAAAGSRLAGKPADVLTLSVQVAAIQAAIWPDSTLGLSYRLSTVAIFGVVIATAGRSFEGWLSGLRLVAMTTVVVNVAMLPILPAESRPMLLVSLLTNIAVAPFIAVSFTLGIVAVASGWLVPPLGEAIAVVAGEINRVTLWVVTEAARIDQLPGPLNTSGRSMPRWFLAALSIAILAAVSTEFRRWVRDTARRPNLFGDPMADVATGAALGVLAATLAIVLLR